MNTKKAWYASILVLMVLCVAEVVFDHPITSFALSVPYKFFHSDYELTSGNQDFIDLSSVVTKGIITTDGLSVSFSSRHGSHWYYYKFTNFSKGAICVSSFDFIPMTGKYSICMNPKESKCLMVWDMNRRPVAGVSFLNLRKENNMIPYGIVGFETVLPR